MVMDHLRALRQQRGLLSSERGSLDRELFAGLQRRSEPAEAAYHWYALNLAIQNPGMPPLVLARNTVVRVLVDVPQAVDPAVPTAFQNWLQGQLNAGVWSDLAERLVQACTGASLGARPTLVWPGQQPAATGLPSWSSAACWPRLASR